MKHVQCAQLICVAKLKYNDLSSARHVPFPLLRSRSCLSLNKTCECVASAKTKPCDSGTCFWGWWRWRPSTRPAVSTPLDGFQRCSRLIHCKYPAGAALTTPPPISLETPNAIGLVPGDFILIDANGSNVSLYPYTQVYTQGCIQKVKLMWALL